MLYTEIPGRCSEESAGRLKLPKKNQVMWPEKCFYSGRVTEKRNRIFYLSFHRCC